VGSPIDWNKVIKNTEEGTKVIPAGEYRVRVTEAEPKTASTGAEMIKTTVKLEDAGYEGRAVTTNLVFTFDNPTAMKMLFRRLQALGITSEWLAETGANVAQIAEAIKGRSCVAKLNVRKWNGEDRNDVEMFLDGVGSGIPSAPTVAGGPSDAPPPPDLSSMEPGPAAAPAPAASGVPSAPGGGPEPF
jgi:hypothetical protein